MDAIQDWLTEMERAYGAEQSDPLVKRFVGWKAPGDTAALLYFALKELRAIRQALERQGDAAMRGNAKRRGER